eukprot:jgi/Botrbrau1/6606/Bobra.0189s0033.1
MLKGGSLQGLMSSSCILSYTALIRKLIKTRLVAPGALLHTCLLRHGPPPMACCRTIAYLGADRHTDGSCISGVFLVGSHQPRLSLPNLGLDACCAANQIVVLLMNLARLEMISPVRWLFI